ncbi:MAG: tripartite tricarboxylate transporter TctB family protein [Deltaproteobacteria bacterium]|nr:tripartite tricarboxylate transporter TctB family protein [Deltaproteobacteria bacterium]
MRVSNKAIGVAVIIFGIAVILYARNFPKLEKGYPGPSLFPIVLAVLFIFAGIVLIIQGIRSGESFLKLDLRDLTTHQIVNIALIVAAILFYIFLSDLLGFQFTSFIILLFLMKRLRVSTLWSLIMACTVTLVIYTLFAKILLVPLPWGLWGW